MYLSESFGYMSRDCLELWRRFVIGRKCPSSNDDDESLIVIEDCLHQRVVQICAEES